MAIDRKNLKTLLIIAVSLTFIGFVLKILNLNFVADPLLVVSLAGICILYTLRYWKKKHKGFLATTKLILVGFWALNGISKIFDIRHTQFLEWIGTIAFLIWIIMEGTTYFVDDKNKDTSWTGHIIWNSLMVIGILAILTGFLARIIAWKYASALLVVGFVLVTSYILKDILLGLLPKKK